METQDNLIKEALLLTRNPDAGNVSQKWVSDITKQQPDLAGIDQKSGVIQLSAQLLQRLVLHKNQTSKGLLVALINHYLIDALPVQKLIHKKILGHLHTLRFYSKNDHECRHLLTLFAKHTSITVPEAQAYLTTRSAILSSIVANSRRRQELASTSTDLQQWFKIINPLFRKTDLKYLVQTFSGLVRNHYKQTKKDPNSLLRGDQALKLVIKLYNFFPPIDLNQTTKDQSPRRTATSPGRSHPKLNSTLMIETQNDKELLKLIAHKNKKTEEYYEDKKDQMIWEITEEVNGLRQALEKQKQVLQMLAQKDRKLTAFVKSIKDKYLELAVHARQQKFDHPNLATLTSRFEEFENRTEKQASSKLQELAKLQQQAYLIKMIEQEQRMS